MNLYSRLAQKTCFTIFTSSLQPGTLVVTIGLLYIIPSIRNFDIPSRYEGKHIIEAYNVLIDIFLYPSHVHSSHLVIFEIFFFNEA